MATYLVTGACGFIGSNLSIRLLNKGHKVIGVDRIEPRHLKIKEELEQFENFKLYDVDLTFKNELSTINEEVDMIYHLAANADVRFSSLYPEKDLNDGIIATYNILNWMKSRGINKIAYSSTSASYGDPKIIPTPEDIAPIQTSFYGASKLAGEALVQAHCAAYGCQSWIYRFASITGPRYSHGYIYNFYSKLKENPNELYIHGGKEQIKTYLDVDDCVSAMLLIVEKASDIVNIFNLGHHETIKLTESIPVITNHMNINPKLTWSGNEVGWIGDSKINMLDVSKLTNLGWKPTITIKQSILRTLNWLDQNPWVLDIRKEQ